MAEPELRPIYPDPHELPAAAAVNHFRCSRVGSEVQLLMGYIDLTELVAAIDRGREHLATADGGDLAIDLPVQVTHRFHMGAIAFGELKRKVDEIYHAMVKSGHIDESEGDAPPDGDGGG